MKVVNEVCKTKAKTHKNPGQKDQKCFESSDRCFMLATEDFAFTNRDAIDSMTEIDAAITAKQLVPFYDIENIEENFVEPVVQAGRFQDYQIADAIDGVKLTQNLTICGYEALKSYDNSNVYTRFFGVTLTGELRCEYQDDGSIKGLPLKNFNVGGRKPAMLDKVPSATISIKFKPYKLSALKPAVDFNSLEGIYDLDFVQVGTLSATTIKVKAMTCNGNLVNSLVTANFTLISSTGVARTVTSLNSPTTGEYTLTGTGFTAGDKLSTNGVVLQPSKRYESTEVLVLS